MLTMSQVNHIKDLSNCGYRICEISEKTGADPKTIRKYLARGFLPETALGKQASFQTRPVQAGHPSMDG